MESCSPFPSTGSVTWVLRLTGVPMPLYNFASQVNRLEAFVCVWLHLVAILDVYSYRACRFRCFCAKAVCHSLKVICLV